jgi:hypothetical protein
MKYKRIFSILALVTVFSLLVSTIPAIANPAITGSESISTDPDSGRVGSDIDITGYDFEEEEDIDIYFTSEDADEGDDIDNVDAYELVKSDTTDEDGYFTSYFYVPDELTDGDDDELVYAGEYYVFVTYAGDDTIVAAVDFTVLSDDEHIVVNPTKGRVGSDIDITGYNFEPEEDVDIYFTSEDIDGSDELDDLDIYERVVSDVTDDIGKFSTSFLVPEVMENGDDEEEVTSGTYYVFVTYEDDTEIIAVKKFIVCTMEICPTLRLPPGLAKKDHFSKFEGRCLPPGWFKGKKTGWDKER